MNGSGAVARTFCLSFLNFSPSFSCFPSLNITPKQRPESRERRRGTPIWMGHVGQALSLKRVNYEAGVYKEVLVAFVW